MLKLKRKLSSHTYPISSTYTFAHYHHPTPDSYTYSHQATCMAASSPNPNIHIMATFSVFYSVGVKDEWWHVMTILLLYTLVHSPKTHLHSAYLTPTSLAKPGIHCSFMSPWLYLVWNVIYMESCLASSFLIGFIQLLIFSMLFPCTPWFISSFCFSIALQWCM